MARLQLGKLPIELLNESVLSMTGAPSGRVKIGARAGMDFAAVLVPGGYLLVSADPVTGASDKIGWYAVNVGANDVATSGNRPSFIETVMLLPEGTNAKDVKRIAKEVHEAALSLKLTVLGGHTEVTPGLSRPIIIVTAFALARNFVSADCAREGDSIMVTKTAGIEGTAILARRAGGELHPLLRRKAVKMEEQFSIVNEAVKAYETGLVHAMHDCTEGGVLGAVYEMSLASNLGFEIRESAIPVAPVTRRVTKALGIDPIKLIGSGSLLMAVERGGEHRVEGSLRGICPVTAIGRFRMGSRTLAHSDGSESTVRRAPTDELWRTLARLGRVDCPSPRVPLSPGLRDPRELSLKRF